MKNKAFRLIYIYIAFTVLSALLIMGLSACSLGSGGVGGKAPEPSPTATPTPVSAPTPSPTPYIEPEAPGIVDDLSTGGGALVTGDPSKVTEETWPKVPETDPVGDEFFDDAAFLGNSLMDGFRLYSGLTNAGFYASTSLTVAGADGMIDQMAQTSYGKVYILLGVNEIDYDSYYFKDLYGDMLDRIEEAQPDADIYICSLTPVSAYKSGTSTSFNMDRIRAYNDRLLELAGERGIYYIDLCEALAGEDGYLPADATTDGVHFDADMYGQWLEYLKTHHA